MEDVIQFMFYKFPRYVGVRQHLVETKEDMIQHMKTYSGVEDCFTSVYSFFHDKPVIDKVFFDIDHSSEECALKIAQTIFEYIKKTFEIEVIPFWSGKKGAHIYPLFQSKIYDNPVDLLKNFSYHIIEKTKSFEIDEKDGKKQPLVDSHVIGDVRRLCRFPNTQRVNHSGLPMDSYCIPLDPDDFLNLTITDIKKLKKTPQKYDYNFKLPTITLDQLKFKKPNISEFKASFNKSDINYDLDFITPRNIYAKILKYSLQNKPCLQKFIMTNNPPDIIRMGTAIELINMGFSTQKMIKMFSSLGWHDWNPEYTAYQIESIRHKNLVPIGKKKIKECGFCIECKDCKGCR